MKFIVLTAALFLSTSVYAAGDLNCTIEETLAGVTTETQLVVPASDDPHGGLTTFVLEKFPQYNGFIALVKGIIVIHLANNENETATSTQSKSAGDSYARLQFLLQFTDHYINSIVIQCGSPE